MKKFHLVYNSDSHYLLPTFVSAASALERASDRKRIVIDVLDCGISDADWTEWTDCLHERFPDVGGVARHRVDIHRIEGFSSWRGSIATYARVLTPEILSDCDMCLFVDGDTLFVADPLELYRVYDAKYWIQGSVDCPCSEERRCLYAGYGLTVPDDYVCCGLMLMNLHALRENGFVEKCLDFLGRYKVLTSVDQEAINCVAHGHIARLDPAWGCSAYTNDELSELSCIHYTTHKPWIPQTEGYMPITSNMGLWFDAAEKLCGIKPWKCWGKWGFWLYWWAKVKTLFFTFIFRILNRLPGLKGRYAMGLKRQWSLERRRRYAYPGSHGTRKHIHSPVRENEKSVCFLMPSPNVGPVGGFKIVYEYANRFVADGWKVCIVFPLYLGAVGYENFWKFLFCHPRAATGSFLAGWQHMKKAVRPEAQWFSLDRRVKKMFPLFISPALEGKLPKDTRFVSTYALTAVALNHFKTPYRYQFIQDREDWGGLERATLHGIYQYKMKKIAIATWLQREVEAIGEKCQLVPNALNFEEFRLLRAIEDRNPCEVAMLWNTRTHKRMGDAIAALELVKDKCSRLHVTAFGVPGRPTDLPDFITYVQKPDNVRHNQIYNNAAIFVASSDLEGWGLTLCEAMMCGAAVVCTNAGGFRDFATNEETALMSEACDIASLASNIIRLMDDDKLRIRIAKAGHQNVQRFTWERSYALMRHELETR